ncbi:MAG: hypothetical protein ACRYFZ_15520 [Janthinobacterium lividum]
MATSNPTPWDFSNEDKNLSSSEGHHRLAYSELSEIAMGGPIGGKCFLLYPDNSKLKVSDWAGGPAVWETGGRRVALPVWTMRRDQRLAVADLHARTLTIYSQKFRVLNLKAFDQGIIMGQDSPIHLTTTMQFATANEPIERVEQF